jgi:hypothetical protein
VTTVHFITSEGRFISQDLQLLEHGVQEQKGKQRKVLTHITVEALTASSAL